MKIKSIGTIKFPCQNKEIWDWRNLRLKERIRIGLSLIFTGIVEIQWLELNQQEIKL